MCLHLHRKYSYEWPEATVDISEPANVRPQHIAISHKEAGLPVRILVHWSAGDELFSSLKAAGGAAYSNYAVGYNNVDVSAATKNGIPVGNTPGVHP